MAEATKVEEGWMVAAFSSWGLSGGGSGEPLLKEEEDKEDIDNDNEADYKKNLILSNEAEEVLDESAKYLVSSAFGAFDDASKYVSDAVAQIDEAGGVVNAIDAPKEEEEQPDIVNEIDVGVIAVEQPGSTMFDSKDSKPGRGNTTDETTPTDKLGAISSMLLYNPLSSLASSWINDLQEESIAKDPHHELRTHLDEHLKVFPKSTYEMWVEEALAFAGYIAVVDETFYHESSIHRNIWNEKMTELAPNVGGLFRHSKGKGGVAAVATNVAIGAAVASGSVVGAVGVVVASAALRKMARRSADVEVEGGDETSQVMKQVLHSSRYVPARPARTSTEVADEAVPVVVSSSSTPKTSNDKNTTPVEKVPSSSTKTSSTPKAEDDADLDNLLNDTALAPLKTPPKVAAASTTPNKSNPLLEASALLDDE